MLLQLNDDDRRAVDLLLGHEQMASNGDDGPSLAAAAGAMHQRLEIVERWLHLLQQMPASEPARDLAGRTLRRLEEAVASGAVRHHPAAQPAAPGAHRAAL